MTSHEAIDEYIQYLALSRYPAEIVRRRLITFKRFLKTYGELNKANIIDFIDANNFLRKQSYYLLKCDFLSLLHYYNDWPLIDKELFAVVDKGILGY
ncbi:MAG: hypothetical protein KDD94_04525 [Calditrichaeota bacterium]|nr:hypothetical protein [Calditrichota bacterium]